MSVSSTTTSNIICFQVIFTGITAKCLHVHNFGWIDCEEVGWHLTFSRNHGQTLKHARTL